MQQCCSASSNSRGTAASSLVRPHVFNTTLSSDTNNDDSDNTYAS
jgi:hypothetical protein